ncbi:hypothetical protein [Helicobacter macacae]|uniref:hypothetical protein n=1 Tax=Helicobacter macacae TaxID=398626 RepID=UPI000411E09A|nr:hypothetical protein [Helicobacter macacae]
MKRNQKSADLKTKKGFDKKPKKLSSPTLFIKSFGSSYKVLVMRFTRLVREINSRTKPVISKSAAKS